MKIIPDWMQDMGFTNSSEDRFWRKVNKSGRQMPHVSKIGNCWDWTGSLDSYGYGSFFKGRKYRGASIASRASWMFIYGRIPEKMCVLHKCDNPACVNPAHLFLGSHRQNMADCSNKGRYFVQKNPSKIMRGEKHPNSKLTDKKVNEIRKIAKSGIITQCEIAKRFKMSVMTISLVVRNKIWTHLNKVVHIETA